MIKACIFDLDGTLLNTITTISYYCNKTLAEFGFEPIEEEDYKYLVGDGAKKLVERMIEKKGIDSEEYFDKMFKFYNREYDNDVSYLTKPYDGIPELLAFLKTNNIKNCVLSNKPDYAACEAIKKFLGDLVDVTHGGRENVPLKPAPDGVEEILAEIGCTPDECLYIGDTSVDMQTGKNAGMYTIGVLWGFRKRDELEESGADVIVSSPDEIMEIVQKR